MTHLSSFVLLFMVNLIQPQQEVVLRESICESCRILFDTILTVDRTTPAPLSDQAVVAVGPQQEAYVLDPVQQPGLMLVYDRLGQIVGRIDIRRIVQPGRPVVDRNGRVLIPDERTGELFPAESGGALGKPYLTVDHPHWIAFLSNGRVVLNALSAELNRTRYALHTLVLGDTLVSSFDRYTGRVLSSSESSKMWRRVWPQDENRIWSAHVAEYKVDRWSLSGGRLTLAESFVRNPSWFKVRSGPVPAARVTSPPSSIRGIVADSAGLLWVVIRVADQNWRPFEVPEDPDGMGGTYYGFNRHLRKTVYDTIVEVIDPTRAVVIARRRLDTDLSTVVGPGYVIEYAAEDNDLGKYHVVRMRIAGMER